MREDDGRRLDHATLEALRLQAVRQVAQGAPPREVAAALGLNRSTVFGWLARYRDGGADALRAKSVPGRPGKFPTRPCGGLRFLAGTDPREFGFEYGLWTRALVRLLIERELGVVLSVASVGRVLRALDLWCSPPSSSGATDPEIRAAAGAAGATVCFVRDATVGSRYPPGVDHLSLLSVTSARSALRFAAYRANLTGDLFVDFCRRLRHDAPGPAFLFVGRHPAYRTAAVDAFVAETHGWLRIFRTPVVHSEQSPVRNA